MAIQFSEFQIDTLNYFLDMVHAYLQGVVSDLNEKEDYRLQCADEIIELDKLVKWINPMGPPKEEEEETEEETTEADEMEGE